jgi:DNA ligase D-like protein (predicted 3'-phosphoesterase)
MPLDEYLNKRNFISTSEPAGKTSNDKTDNQNTELVFVVHEHHASHLHYDLRLELDGVLKSWAIPKGPTTNPQEKRLAVMVEDHPFEYRNFEGEIPEGNYGAGKVYVWDKGTYEAVGAKNSKESSNIIREGISRGHISFILKGKRLKGEFALVKLKKSNDKNWLMIKKSDEFADTFDITQENKQF